MLALLALLACRGDPVMEGEPGDPTRGAQLAAVARCAGCHTREEDDESGAAEPTPWAGGFPVETPFGTFYGTNLTPDPDHGLGGWTEVDFVRAMRRGTAPDGRQYYPAFPYPSFTGMTDQDLRDLWAFLQTIPADPAPNRAHEVAPGFDQRFLLRFWKLLELREGPFEPDPAWSPEVARGAYLGTAVAHCGECHTPRDGLGGVKPELALSGSDLEPDGGPNITPHADGADGWSLDDWDTFLDMGMTPEGDFTGGSMKDVVRDGTSKLSADDRRAIGAWLMQVTPLPNPPSAEGAEGHDHDGHDHGGPGAADEG